MKRRTLKHTTKQDVITAVEMAYNGSSLAEISAKLRPACNSNAAINILAAGGTTYTKVITAAQYGLPFDDVMGPALKCFAEYSTKRTKAWKERAEKAAAAMHKKKSETTNVDSLIETAPGGKLEEINNELTVIRSMLEVLLRRTAN